MKLFAVVAPFFFFASLAIADNVDPYIYLEQAHGDQALAWVKAHNDKTLPSLEQDPRFADIQAKIQQVVFTADRIPSPTYQGGMVYNLWQDTTHVRGLWRRTTLAEYAKPSPAWETVLDLDQLAQTENENWVWKNSTCLPPAYQRCLIQLSRGGQDAAVYREFDVGTKAFVSNGFILPEAKSSVAWIDMNHLFIATDFGPGTLTNSGYPRIVKLWTRGKPLSDAVQVFAGTTSDIEVSGVSYLSPNGPVPLIFEGTTFFTNNIYLVNLRALSTQKLPLPANIELQGVFQNKLLLLPQSDWQTTAGTFRSGSLVAVDVNSALNPKPSLVYAPAGRASIEELAYTPDFLFLNVLDNVKSRVVRMSLSGGAWAESAVAIPSSGAIHLLPSDAYGDTLLAQYESFLVPSTVFAVPAKAGTEAAAPQALRKLTGYFDSTPFVTEQFESTSRDGTKIPYFVVHRKDMPLDGSNPTVQYGYGGFEISEKPSYSGAIGKAWLEAGGVYVLANIRGGGEFGPAWHTAAILENKQKSYDDFISVSEDLIARKITSPRKLAIEGGSNGGLLVGAVFVERPDLYNAVVCQVPLLDMIRFPLLGAGASWEAEYGDPSDPHMREVILGYSPYQNVKAGVTYPEVFFETSTEDDRVTPAHARKMAALMEAQGHAVYYYENVEGGHGADANLNERVTRVSLEFTYLARKLMQP